MRCQPTVAVWKGDWQRGSSAHTPSRAQSNTNGRSREGTVRPVRIICAMALMVLPAQVAHADVDPALLAAARQEGQVVWYTGLIVNQIVRPMAEAFAKKYP